MSEKFIEVEAERELPGGEVPLQAHSTNVS